MKWEMAAKLMSNDDTTPGNIGAVDIGRIRQRSPNEVVTFD
jgi:hypothetical protein